MINLEGRLVIVAGGTGGLGQVVTSRFVEAGAEVVASYLSEAELAIFQADFPQYLDHITFRRLDAFHEDKVVQFVDSIVEEKGVPDGLINLIGGYTLGPQVMDSDPSHFSLMFDLNFHTTFNLCRATLPLMIQAGKGKIVNIGGRVGLFGEAQHAAYSIAKSSVIRLTEALSSEVKDKGINVNCILPSIIDTPNNRQDMPEADFSRWVSPSDLAEVILFLASDGARAIHGASLPVYGRL